MNFHVGETPKGMESYIPCTTLVMHNEHRFYPKIVVMAQIAIHSKTHVTYIRTARTPDKR